jgi:glycerate dehydrogenase
MNEPARFLKTGVFLDLETVDSGDLDRSRLQATLADWRWHDFSEAEAIPQRIAGANVVISNKCVISRAAMEQAPRLALIALAATGSNNVDLEAAGEHGITVCNIRDYATDAVAQHTITLMLNLLTGQPWYWQRVREGAWSHARQFCLNDRPIRQARGLAFGVIGYGVLGRAAGALAKALGMRLLVAERRGARPREGRLDFEAVVAGADVLSIHCPLTVETRGLVDRQLLRSMKEGAVLINTARGGIVVEQDLADALRAGEIAGAAVDTLSQEPPPPEHVLLAPDIPHLLVTPHNAWASRTARQAALDQLARVISEFAAGRVLNQVHQSG